MNAKPNFREALLEALAEEERLPVRHPTAEQLWAFRAKDLPPQREREILEHLGRCRECVDQVSFYSEFAGEDSATSSPDEPAEEAPAPLLHPIAGRSQSGRTPRRSRAARRFRRASTWIWNQRFGLAAGILLMVLPVGYQWRQARRTITALSQPQVNVELFHVRRPTRGAATAPEASVFDVGAEDQRFVVVLPTEGSFETYQIRILAADGRELWRNRELRPEPFGLHLRLELSRRFLSAGEYRFEVSGLKDGEPASTTAYKIVLRYL